MNAFSLEAVIASRPHLPRATEYLDEDSLKDVRDTVLVAMATECASCTDNMDAFRASLVTPAALVLWRVLIAEERMLVSAALYCVSGEIGARKFDESADAVPPPGEDVMHLGEDTSTDSAGEYALIN